MSAKIVIPASLVNIIFYSLALKWTVGLRTHDCKCAKEWRLQYMNAYFIMAIFGSLLTIAAVFRKQLFPLIFKYWVPLMALATVLYGGIGLSYLVDLKKKKCDCARGAQMNFMYVLAIIQVITIGLGVFSLAYLRARHLI
jgi:hypothetical protein